MIAVLIVPLIILTPISQNDVTSLSDERIDQIWIGHMGSEWRVLYSRGQHHGIAYAIVQLIRLGTSGVIAPSQPIRSEE